MDKVAWWIALSTDQWWEMGPLMDSPLHQPLMGEREYWREGESLSQSEVWGAGRGGRGGAMIKPVKTASPVFCPWNWLLPPRVGQNPIREQQLTSSAAIKNWGRAVCLWNLDSLHSQLCSQSNKRYNPQKSFLHAYSIDHSGHNNTPALLKR